MITGFMSNPQKGFDNLQETIIPGWQRLEEQAGGKLSFLLTHHNGTITISLYKMSASGGLDIVQSFTPYGFFQSLTDKNFTIQNGNEPLAIESAATADSTGDDTATSAAGIDTNASTGSEPATTDTEANDGIRLSK